MVILAGPAVNILIAFVIVWALLLRNGQVIPRPLAWPPVEPATPAAAVLQAGDQVVSVDGVSGSEARLRRQIGTHQCAGARSRLPGRDPGQVVVRRTASC